MGFMWNVTLSNKREETLFRCHGDLKQVWERFCTMVAIKTLKLYKNVISKTLRSWSNTCGFHLQICLPIHGQNLSQGTQQNSAFSLDVWMKIQKYLKDNLVPISSKISNTWLPGNGIQFHTHSTALELGALYHWFPTLRQLWTWSILSSRARSAVSCPPALPSHPLHCPCHAPWSASLARSWKWSKTFFLFLWDLVDFFSESLRPQIGN